MSCTLSMYSHAIIFKVTLLSLIFDLSDATPINTTDKEDCGRSYSSRLRIHISDATIYLFN
jgi:hypothetical protein